MKSRASASPTLATRESRQIAWMVAALAVATFAAYANSLQAPLVYDDIQAIAENESIRRLWPLSRVLLPLDQQGLTVSGRPILNLSLALNYAVSGTAVWSYHVFNILIHAGAALLLFGIVRRTLAASGAGKTDDLRVNAAWVAFAIAALWALHPLQTQAVTYTVQRAESLMGFFYLLTLYAFIRAIKVAAVVPTATSDAMAVGTTAATSHRWTIACVLSCALGMATKEVMATAPLLIFLYDRTFIAGSFRAAWRERRALHLGLAATWLVLAALIASTGGNRGGTVGLATGVPLWAYPLTQFKAIATYLALSGWPQPLVFEYGTFWVRSLTDLLPYAIVVVPLLVATAIALVRASVPGFLGAWFFLILAPTSLAPGTIQMIVEHRMYLPLAAIVTAVALAAQALGGRRALIGVAALAVAAGPLAYRRNGDYRNHLTLWGDTVAKRPLNPRAHEGLAEAYDELGQHDEAIREFTEAARLQPDESRYRYNVGHAVAKAGRYEEAIAQYEQSLRITPNEPRTHNNLAIALGHVGRAEEAFRHYAEAERLAPRDPQYPFNHGMALQRIGRVPEAIACYEAALRLRPDYADAHFNLAAALVTSGRLEPALEHYAAAARLAPVDPEIRSAYGNALILAHRASEALPQFRAALAAAPGHSEARFGEGNALMALRLPQEAITAYEAVLRDQPNHANAHFKLGNALFDTDRVAEAATQYEAAIRLRPDDAEAHHNLGTTYARMERWTDARREFETALRLKPDYPEAKRHLEQVKSIMGF